MALHAIAILSTSRACMDIPPELTTPTGEATPTHTESANVKPEKATPTTKLKAIKSSSSPASAHSKPHPPSTSDSTSKSAEAQKVMRLTPCPGNKYFRLFVVELLKMFDRDNKTLLDKKGSFIIRYNIYTCTFEYIIIIMYICMCIHVLMRDERSKQDQTNNKAKQHSTPKAVTCTWLSQFIQ